MKNNIINNKITKILMSVIFLYKIELSNLKILILWYLTDKNFSRSLILELNYSSIFFIYFSCYYAFSTTD